MKIEGMSCIFLDILNSEAKLRQNILYGLFFLVKKKYKNDLILFLFWFNSYFEWNVKNSKIINQLSFDILI